MACWCKGDCPNIAAAAGAIAAERHYEAQKILEMKLLEAPHCVEANLALGGVLTELNLAAFGEVHIERARATMGADSARYLYVHGRNLMTQTRLADAAAEFRRAIQLNADHFAAWTSLVECLTKMALLDEATGVLREIEKKFLDSARLLYRLWADVFVARKSYGEAIAAWPASLSLRPRELFDRGRCYDQVGEHDKAWADWMSAKSQLREFHGHGFDADGVRILLENLQHVCQPGRLELLEEGYLYNPYPIFIGGFPRSGTTMMETVLSAHSKIVAGDEMRGVQESQNLLPMLLDIATPYPHCLPASGYGNNVGVMQRLGETYTRRARHKIETEHRDAFVAASHFTDKMPLNELHWPFIATMLPSSTFFYLRRHPLDILVSTMSYWIRHGWDYASSIESAVNFYVMADKLLQHYKNTFPLKIHEIRYEDFVADQADTTIKMMDILQLDIEPAQMTFHTNARHSRTISHDQVRTPLYNSSVGRYKNYLPHIPKDIVDALRPIMEREGYEV